MGATSATLDRVYEGPTAATAAFSVFQNVYALPSNARLLANDAFVGTRGPLRRFTRGEINAFDPSRVQTGTPQGWASFMDDASTPPNLQVEIWPVPDATSGIGIPYEYTADTAPLSATSAVMLPWLNPACLLEGVSALALRNARDYTGAELAIAAAEKALKQLRSTEGRSLPPAHLALDAAYTRHRLRRGNR